MNLLVTGGCGFIGSNFVRQRLRRRLPRSPAGQPRSSHLCRKSGKLVDMAGDARYVFARGDIGDETWWPGCLPTTPSMRW